LLHQRCWIPASAGMKGLCSRVKIRFGWYRDRRLDSGFRRNDEYPWAGFKSKVTFAMVA
jgi:hypothetical protein